MARKALVAILALFGAANALRCVLSLQQAATVPDLPVAFSPWLGALFGGVWAAGFAIAAVAVRARRSSAIGPAVVAAYHAHLWLNRAVFARSDDAWVTAGFSLMLTAIALAVTGALAWLSRAPRPFARPSAAPGQRGGDPPPPSPEAEGRTAR